MISIIPEREVLKSVTDENIDSDASKKRVKAFSDASDLLAYTPKPAEVVIEGNLYALVEKRLLPSHKIVFVNKYDIDNSGLQTPQYGITRSIKFIIAERKLIHQKRKVIVITENGNQYAEYEQNQNDRVRIFKCEEFSKRIERFHQIKKNYTEMEDALTTVFFVE